MMIYCKSDTSITPRISWGFKHPRLSTKAVRISYSTHCACCPSVRWGFPHVKSTASDMVSPGNLLIPGNSRFKFRNQQLQLESAPSSAIPQLFSFESRNTIQQSSQGMDHNCPACVPTGYSRCSPPSWLKSPSCDLIRVAYFCACQPQLPLKQSAVHYLPLLPRTVHADTAHVSSLNLNGWTSIPLISDICSATRQ